MDLIDRDNVTKALGLQKVGLESLSPHFYKLLGMERANEFYHKHAGQPTPQFIDALFEDLDVKLDVKGEALAQIPKEGAFWFIANHPTGIWDGLAMMKLIQQVRPEFKVITLFMLERLAELRPRIVPVNNWKDKSEMRSNLAAMKDIFRTLNAGNPVGLFPGGSVSRFIKRFGRITDPPWNPTAIRMMQRARVPILPIYIDSRNSAFFYFLAVISHTLRRGRNFGEFFNKKGKTIPIKIGKIIEPEEWATYEETDALSDFLRGKVYGLKP